jgi:hypothetical protein
MKLNLRSQSSRYAFAVGILLLASCQRQPDIQQRRCDQSGPYARG